MPDPTAPITGPPSEEFAPSSPKVTYATMFPWEITPALAARPIGYLPLGVLEWHGEHAAVGLDGIKAEAVCIAAARRGGGLVLPPLWWGADGHAALPDGDYLTGGIELGERYHVPGSMFWLRPETFANLLLDIFEAMRRRGFRAIILLAGHWSPDVYLPTIHAAGAAFTARHPEVGWSCVTDQELIGEPAYPMEHAAGGETSLLMAIRPELVALDLTLETDRGLAGAYATQPAHLTRRRTTPHKYIGLFTGRADASNDPETTATAARGHALLDQIAARLAAHAAAVLADATATPPPDRSDAEHPPEDSEN